MDYLLGYKLYRRLLSAQQRKRFYFFAADKRNLTTVPRRPNAPHNANAKDINTVADAENLLYLINSEKFSTKRQFIDALKNTDYDIIIMDLFHFEKVYAAAEMRELKTKRNGGKLLVICWRGRGLSVLLK